jgi:hypothetical protein
MMSTPMKAIGLALALALLGAPAVMLAACDDSSSAIKETPVTPTPTGGGGTPVVEAGPGTDGSTTGDSGGPSDCVMNPQTHLEIINACTDAVKITKNPTLPLLLPDGGLPPLP